MKKISCSIFFICGLLFSPFQLLYAQDVEPRRWSALPTKSNIIGAGYAFTTGDVLFDPVLETEDVSINFSTFLLSYVKPFKLKDKPARVDVLIPFGFQLYEGLLRGEPTSIYRNGFGDARIRFSINFTGAPAGNAQELQAYFREHPVQTTFGTSLAVTLPTGQYFEEKLLNIGQNQIVIRPQIGFVHNWRSWSYELTGSVYFFSNNNNFFNNTTRKQEPLFALQTHLIKRFSPRFWTSASLSYGLGGTSEVNNVSKTDYRTNLLSALSLGGRIGTFQSIKVAYLNSRTLKDIGSNSHNFILAWSYLFL